MSKKILFSLIFSALFLVALGVFIFKETTLTKNTPEQSHFAISTSTTSVPINFENVSKEKDYEINTSPTTSSATDQIDFIRIPISINELSYTVDAAEGTSVYDAMVLLAGGNSFHFKERYYSGLGNFIEEINGIKNANGAYWTLYINEKYCLVGASEYKLHRGDSVQWKFEKK